MGWLPMCLLISLLAISYFKASMILFVHIFLGFLSFFYISDLHFKKLDGLTKSLGAQLVYFSVGVERNRSAFPNVIIVVHLFVAAIKSNVLYPSCVNALGWSLGTGLWNRLLVLCHWDLEFTIFTRIV